MRLTVARLRRVVKADLPIQFVNPAAGQAEDSCDDRFRIGSPSSGGGA
jgi:hypothetical protein